MPEPLLKVGPLSFKGLFRDLTLTLYPGELVQLKGPSGAGKTTLLRQVVGLEKGEARRLLAGKDFGPEEMAAFRARCLYLAPEAPVIEGDLRTNLLFPFRFKVNQKRPRRDPEALLEALGLKKPLSTPAESLSTGERQRLALARALLLGPEVILADEPFSALDEKSFRKAFELLMAFVREDNRAVLCVSHLELPSKSRTLVLKDGQLREIR